MAAEPEQEASRYLLAVASTALADPDAVERVTGWVGKLAAAYRVAIMVDLLHPPGVRHVRALCTGLGLRLIVSPPPPRSGVVLATEVWDVVELDASLDATATAGLLAALRARARIVVGPDAGIAGRIGDGVFVPAGSGDDADRTARIAAALRQMPPVPPPDPLPEPGFPDALPVAFRWPVPPARPILRPTASKVLRLLHVGLGRLGQQDDVGGERLARILCQAARVAAPERGLTVETTLLVDADTAADAEADDAEADDVNAFELHRSRLRGDGIRLGSLDHPVLLDAIGAADVVHVHGCLGPFALLAASSARLLGKRVIGSDQGGHGVRFLYDFPWVFRIYDAIQTCSGSEMTAFLDFDVPRVCIPVPLDEIAVTSTRGPFLARQDLLAFGRRYLDLVTPCAFC